MTAQTLKELMLEGSSRSRFLTEEWPKTRERIELFDLDLQTLLEENQ